MGKRSARETQKGRSKKRKVVICFVIILALLAGLIGFTVYTYLSPPSATGAVTVTIDEGSSLDDIGNVLTKNEVIRSKQVFILYQRAKGDVELYQSGNYTFNRPVTLDEINDILVAGPEAEKGVSVTIPEGYNVDQIATLLEESGLGSRQVYLDLAAAGDFDYSFLQFTPAEGARYKLEGYLFPDTYTFTTEMTEADVLNVMLGRFQEIAQEVGATSHEIVTLASIVEKEAVVDSERETIAGVFTNRINQAMKLESCATVHYALGRNEFTPVVTFDDIAVDSPYNTYMYQGLPAGPVASPGKASLAAAANPLATDYLYFVAKGDGSHEFNVDFASHDAAAAKYL